MKRNTAMLITLVVLIATVSPAAYAAAAGGAGGLPWEGPLQRIGDSLAGPVAFAMSLAGVAVTGLMLVFGGEIGMFASRSAYMVLAVSLLVFARNLLTTLFAAGALI